MPGLRDILDAATPGEWWVDADEENLDVRAVEHAVARVAGAMTMEPDADPGVKARALADASLMALAPELAALVLDMGEALAHTSIPPGFSREHSRDLLARLDAIGREE